MPVLVWLALTDLLYDVLEFMDGDTQFVDRLEHTGFAVLYSVTLLGSLAVPAAGTWFAARITREWVLDGTGFLPALLVSAGYVAWPIAGHGADGPVVMLAYGGLNLAKVLILLALTATGLGAVFGWALRATVRQMRGIGTMTSRALPLLLLVTTFGFFTAEIWQTTGILPPGRMRLVLLFFGVVGGLFLLSVFSAELRAITILSETAQVASLPGDHPFRELMAGVDEPIEPGPLPSPLERANMVFILVLTQALQALVFGILVFVLFVVLGQMAVPLTTIKAWTGRAPTGGSLFGIQVPISGEMIQVCTFIAGFSALYFIVTVVTDAAHRKTYFDPILDHLKVSLAARSIYLAWHSTQPPL